MNRRDLLVTAAAAPLAAFTPLPAAATGAIANGTDAAWSAWRAARAEWEQDRLEDERFDEAEEAMMAAPVQTAEDARRKLWIALDLHVPELDKSDWSWKLVKSALDGLERL